MNKNIPERFSRASATTFNRIILLAVSYFKIREPLKTQKSRLAAEAKAEFTKVNEHFDEGA
jgi:hypothetical protein